MRFVDLFCGIGGFHAALEELGHDCVFACDIDEAAAEVYETNFGIQPKQDIRECKNLPDFDILCAGFPCQPFSKSGSQEGFEDETRGTLFHEIMRIVKESNPSILFLENVPNLESHDGGNTFHVIRKSIKEAGYRFWSEVLSPHKFGTPQIRKRLFMVGIKEDLCHGREFSFPEETNETTDVRDILDPRKSIPEKYNLSPHQIEVIETWNRFIKKLPSDLKPPSPTWSQEFGRNYPLKKIHPISSNRTTVKNLKKILLDEGQIAPESRFRKDTVPFFPPYIQSSKTKLPEWKKGFIEKNREFWEEASQHIDPEWLDKIREFKHTYQKFEWQVGDSERDIWSHMIQLRPSGIRVKKSDYIPALVAIAQVPIVGWQKRRMTPKECARAQDFDVDGLKGTTFHLDTSDSSAYKQLGNAVNVKVTGLIMEKIEQYLQGDTQ